MVCNYGLQGRLLTCVINNEFGCFNAHKSIIKRIVWGSKIMRRRATCYLYPELSMYLNIIRSMAISMSWKFVSQYPNTMEKVCSLMVVIMSTQPKKICRNMNNDKEMCGMCNSHVRENPKHVLFECPGLEPFCANGWRQVVNSMPPAMAREMERMDHDRKLELIASGLGGSYVREWDGIYFHIVSFVYYMYSISQEICTRFLLCCALLWLYIDWFSHIHQAYFTGTVAI